MIDTGCSLTLASERVARDRLTSVESIRLETMGGDVSRTRGSVMLGSVMYQSQEPVLAHVLPRLPMQVDLVMGLDVILRVGLQIGGNHQGIGYELH